MKRIILMLTLLVLTSCDKVWIYPTHLDQDCVKKVRQQGISELRAFQDAYTKCLHDKGDYDTGEDEQWHDTYNYLNK